MQREREREIFIEYDFTQGCRACWLWFPARDSHDSDSWVLTLTLIMITIMIMALAAGRSPALPCVVFWCPYQTLNRIKLCINTHCDDDGDDDDARMSSHMPPKGTWGVVVQGNVAEAGAWFGKCNLMQTLRLHDDFIVECCAHTHTHMHAYVCEHISTYGLLLPGLFRRQQITLTHTRRYI